MFYENIIEETLRDMEHGVEVGSIIFQMPEDEKLIAGVMVALKRQISTKGLIEKYETINGGVLGEGRVCVCPVCKEAIVPVNYCGECGQKLDWSE